MFPSLTFNDSAYLGAGESVSFTQSAETCLTWFVECANSLYIAFRYFCHSMFFSCSNKSISYSVSVISRISSKVQVIRSNAQFSITSVPNYFSFWYFSISNSIRKTMGIFPSRMIRRVEFSVSSSCPSSRPKPAIVRLFYILPESFFRFGSLIVTFSNFRPDFHLRSSFLNEVRTDVVAHDGILAHDVGHVKEKFPWR